MIGAYRQLVVPKATGRVLEIGIGAGANLSFYDRTQVEQIIGVEPSPELRTMAMRSAAKSGLPVNVIDAAAEALPADDASFDTVVSTFTLCSVTDNLAALREARRVLRPGGRLIFCEHGLADDLATRERQQRWDPLWARVFGGCHINRPVRASINSVFDVIEGHGGFEGKRPSLGGWLEWGEARAAS